MLARFRHLASLLAFMLIGTAAQGQSDNTVPIVVPAGPGSAPDIIARILGDELRARLGQPTVIDNKVGAGGIVAVNAARTAASPNTLLLAQAAVVTVTPLTYRAARYDLEQDMEPVAVIADTPMLFVANMSSGPRSLADAIALARSRPDAVPMTSPSRGSIPNLAAEILAQATGTSFNLVPMGTSAQAIQAVTNGDSLISVDGIAPLLPLVKSGRLRALAVTSAKTLPGLEGLPLARETVPGLEATGWFMLFAKKGTPAARVRQINEAVNVALKSPEVIQKLAATANFPVGGSVEDARAFLAREKKLWAAAVQRAGLQPE
jgi:tripartite-type tricarboxylate transporter receptor subunit TctC